MVAALVGGEVVAVVAIAAAAIAAAGQEVYPMFAAADGVAAIVPGPVIVREEEFDLSIQHLALMAEVAVSLAAEAEEEIEDLALEHSHTWGEIEHEVDMEA